MNLPEIYYQKATETGSSAQSQTQTQVFDALMEEWKDYIILKEREFIIHEWFICLIRTGSNAVKAIERIEWWWKINMQNTIRRELVIRIKRRWDDIVAWKQSIKNLEKVLLICAWDTEKRNFLFWITKKYEELIQNIQGDRFDKDTEKEAEEFYNECIHWLYLSASSVAVLQSFSWAHEEKYTNFPYICHSWMMIVCIIKMIDFHKE